MGTGASLPAGLPADVRAHLRHAGLLGDIGHLFPVPVVRFGYLAGSWRDSRLPGNADVHTHEFCLQAGYDPAGVPCDVDLRLYTPPADAAVTAAGPSAASAVPALILFFHGGGFTIGSIASHDGACRRLALETGLPVASVGYHLGPDYTFVSYPNPLDDCVAAYVWCVQNGHDMLCTPPAQRTTPVRIILAGDSAGGHLSVSVALRLLAHNKSVAAASSSAMSLQATSCSTTSSSLATEASCASLDPDVRSSSMPVKLQGPVAAARSGPIRGVPLAPLPLPLLMAPLYPVVDFRGGYPSRTAYARGLELTAALVDYFNTCCLGPDVSTYADLARDELVSPLLHPCLSELPPCVLLTCEFDVLHDEGVVFVAALQKASVPVVHIEARGQIHGFLTHMRAMPSSQQYFTAYCRAIRRFADTGTLSIVESTSVAGSS